VSVRIWFVAIEKFFATPFQLFSSASVDFISSGMSVFHTQCQKWVQEPLRKIICLFLQKRKLGRSFQSTDCRSI